MPIELLPCSPVIDDDGHVSRKKLEIATKYIPLVKDFITSSERTESPKNRTVMGISRSPGKNDITRFLMKQKHFCSRINLDQKINVSMIFVWFHSNITYKQQVSYKNEEIKNCYKKL